MNNKNCQFLQKLAILAPGNRQPYSLAARWKCVKKCRDDFALEFLPFSFSLKFGRLQFWGLVAPLGKAY